MEFKNRYFDPYHIIRDLYTYKVYTKQELVERYSLESEANLDIVLAQATATYS